MRKRSLRPRLLTRLHSIVISVWIVFATIVLGLLAICCALFSKTGNSMHWVARIWGASILWVSGIRVTLSGVERISGLGSCIYMSNHQSNSDIPVLLGLLPGQFRWLAKKEVMDRGRRAMQKA